MAPSGFGGNPDFERGNKLAWRRFADIHTIGGDPLSVLQMKSSPRLWHPTKSHLLYGLAGGRIHDGGKDAYRVRVERDCAGCLHASALFPQLSTQARPIFAAQRSRSLP